MELQFYNITITGNVGLTYEGRTYTGSPGTTQVVKCWACMYVKDLAVKTYGQPYNSWV
jgi:hypothetical protein